MVHKMFSTWFDKFNLSYGYFEKTAERKCFVALSAELLHVKSLARPRMTHNDAPAIPRFKFT